MLLQELLPVLPRLEPDGEPARIRSNFTNGLKRLPVRIGRADRVERRPAAPGATP